MLIKELLKLTPQERDIIYYWRILYCKQIDARKIRKDLGYSDEEIKQTIAKFNKNTRLKWEIIDAERRCKALMEAFFYEQN